MLSIILGAILGALIYYKIVKPANFWRDKNVTHVKSWPLIGSMWPFVSQKKNFLEIPKDIYDKHPNDRYVGYMQFGTPCLLIRDPEIIKQIGVKEFDSFHDHVTVVENERLLSKSLINLTGDQWKQMRATLSPVFTSSKIKNMYHLIQECSENFAKHFEGKEAEIEVKDVFTRFTNDVIASAAFGIQVNSLDEPKNEFYTMGRDLTTVSGVQLIKAFFAQIIPYLGQIFNLKLLPEKVSNFFENIVLDNIRRRDIEGIVRPDLIHLLMEARKGKLKYDHSNDSSDGFATVEESEIGKNTKQIELTDDYVVGQALLFFFAGFDTVSTGASFLAYELAINPDVQKKLQEEIDFVIKENQGKVSYNTIQSMKYLDQVVCEGLRMWPPAAHTDRLCRKQFVITPTKPQERSFTIEPKVSAIIPIIGLHRDPQYFPNPQKFDPERFSDENKSKILPGSYLPFGIGPRNCIGSRFALLELKTLFFHLLSKCDIVPTDKTEIPIKASPNANSLVPKNGIHLALKARK